MTFRREDRGRETVLLIGGELDAVTSPELRQAVDQLVEEQRKQIVVDVADLQLIDSSGVAVLVSLFKRTRAHGGDFTVRGARNQPLAVFKLLRMDRVFVQLGSDSDSGEIVV